MYVRSHLFFVLASLIKMAGICRKARKGAPFGLCAQAWEHSGWACAERCWNCLPSGIASWKQTQFSRQWTSTCMTCWWQPMMRPLRIQSTPSLALLLHRLSTNCLCIWCLVLHTHNINSKTFWIKVWKSACAQKKPAVMLSMALVFCHTLFHQVYSWVSYSVECVSINYYILLKELCTFVAWFLNAGWIMYKLSLNLIF